MKKRIVIKIGSSSIVSKNKIQFDNLIELAKSIKELKTEYDLVVVTSGAIALGGMKLNSKPKTIKEKQAYAAIGQVKLIQLYEQVFSMYDLNVAQILLNHDDFDDRNRMLNLENTLNSLFEQDIIPIINENDALAVEEIKVGDNDTLGALTSILVQAKILILCSDIDGLYDKNPSVYSDAIMIKTIENVNELNVSTEGVSASDVGTGGMATKIKAAKITNSCNCDMIIMNSKNMGNISDAINNKIGSRFLGHDLINRYQAWMKYFATSKGLINVDLGAMNALKNRKSLLPSGIISVDSIFASNNVIDIAYNNQVFAKGKIKYSSNEVKLAIGKSTKECSDILNGPKEIIHANEIVLLEV